MQRLVAAEAKKQKVERKKLKREMKKFQREAEGAK